jgi:O-glycosyl hydrolase
MALRSLLLLLASLALVTARHDTLARRQASSSDANATTALNATSVDNTTGIVIETLLSNWWNNTQYLAETKPNIPFLTNVTYLGTTQNSTDSQPLIIGVEIKEHRQFQRMTGLGAAITDSAAIVLQSLRVKHPEAYDEILNLCFNESPEWLARGGAGMNFIRTPIGASDFGFAQYTYDDTVDGTPDPNITQFNINMSPKRWQTVQDILKINPRLKIMASAWSPPAWMKGRINGDLGGGSILVGYEDSYAQYLTKFVQALKKEKGINVNYLTLVNEPLYTTPVRPTTAMKSDQQARIGLYTRARLDAAGLQKVKIMAYDHNWDNPSYAIDVFDRASQYAQEPFAGVAWHCYGGDPSGQEPFNEAYPDREIMMTECTRITQYGDEAFNNLKKQFNNLLIGSVNGMSSAVILWNLALQVDKEGMTLPILPNQCLNCLAPILVYDNSTLPNLEGANMTAFQEARQQAEMSKRDVHQRRSLHRRQKNTAKIGNGIADGPTFTPPPTGTINNATGIKVPASQTNVGAENENDIIPPFRSTYYRTSDFVALAHLGKAIRPSAQGVRRAQRIGVVTTEDNHSSQRLQAQVFRNGLGNGRSRWSVLLAQQADHYNYAYAQKEDVTVQIKFRESVATIVVPPGVFTLQFEADDTVWEQDP